MRDGPNRGEIEFWNAAPGRNWADRQADLDEVYSGATEILLDSARPQPGERVLDVGCGAGASSLAFAAAVGPGGSVCGIDVSRPLLERARARVREAALATVSFVEADAQEHAFPGAAFDLVVSRFGMMFFADPVAAFCNLRTALRTGGRMAFVAWSGAEANPWFTVPKEVAIARLGGVPEAPPEAPGPMAFQDIDRVVGLMRQAGLAEGRGERVDTFLSHSRGIEALTALATVIGPTARILREKDGDAEDRAAIAADLATRLEVFRDGGEVRVPAAFNVFIASRT